MINITRETAYADRVRNYKVEIDGKLVGEIADGENKNFDVSPGRHTLCLKIDWAKSNEEVFEITSKKTISFRCVSNLKGRKAWLAIIYVLFLPHKYIKLKRLT